MLGDDRQPFEYTRQRRWIRVVVEYYPDSTYPFQANGATEQLSETLHARILNVNLIVCS